MLCVARTVVCLLSLMVVRRAEQDDKCGTGRIRLYVHKSVIAQMSKVQMRGRARVKWDGVQRVRVMCEWYNSV